MVWCGVHMDKRSRDSRVTTRGSSYCGGPTFLSGSSTNPEPCLLDVRPTVLFQAVRTGGTPTKSRDTTDGDDEACTRLTKTGLGSLCLLLFWEGRVGRYMCAHISDTMPTAWSLWQDV